MPGELKIVPPSENLPSTTALQPKQLEAIEDVLVQVYRHQYRHVPHVGWMKLAGWVCFAVFFQFLGTAYVNADSAEEIVKSVVGGIIMGLVLTSLVSVFARCVTRLFHFKFSMLRVTQFYVYFAAYQAAMPFALYLSHFHSKLEYLLFLGHLVVFAVLWFRVFIAFVPTKQLRISTITYWISITVLFGALLSYDRFRGWVLNENEVFVYKDFGARSAKSTDAIDKMIDESIRKLR